MVAALILLLLVALLAVPFALRFEFAGRPKPGGRMQLRWAFGLVRVNLSTEDTEPDKAPRKEPGDRALRRRKRNRRGRRGHPAALLRDAAFRDRCLRFVADLWRAIGKQGLRLRLLIGLGDPAETGRLWAWVGPVAALAGQLEGIAIDIEPDFTDATLEYEGSGTIRIIPLQILALLAGMALSPAIWRGLVRTHATGA